MYLKPRIFIGSSKESRKIAEQVKENLSPEYVCVIWYDNFFKLNQNTYDNLVKESMGFDYAVFIGGKDDIVVRRESGVQKTAPRDNVYLEFGLYAGVLSPARSYFLIHKSCTVSSDLFGVTVLSYSNKKDVKKCCDQLIGKMEEENRINRIKLLPSTSLAIGYFENFLTNAGEALFHLESVEVGGKVYDVKKYEKRLEVIIPDNINEDWKSWAEVFYQKNHMQGVTLDSRIKKIGVSLDVSALKEKRVRLVDIPQTIRAALQSVELVLGKDYIGSTELLETVKRKEIDNFVKTLENLIKTDSYVNAVVSIQII